MKPSHCNDVTLCLAYYENPTMLVRQLRALDALPAELQAHIGLRVVDDGSPEHPALPVWMGTRRPELAHGAQLWRMGVDIPWNQDACRNIAAREAETKWLLLTDMDHLVPEGTWRAVIMQKLSWKMVYKFARVSEPDLSPYKQHPNTWLMTRDLFDAAGGYDERFAGWYGTDGDFRNRVQAKAKIENLKAAVIRVPREVTPDASTTTIERRTPETLANLDRIKAERARSRDPSPMRYRFPCERVA